MLRSFLLLACLAAVSATNGSNAGTCTCPCSCNVKPPLRVTSIIQPPFLQYNNNSQIVVGFCKDLADKIGKRLNRTVELKLVADGRYGSESNPGVWNGMIGEVVNGTVDIAVAPITITSNRSKVVYFTQPFMTNELSFLRKFSNSSNSTRNVTFADLDRQIQAGTANFSVAWLDFGATEIKMRSAQEGILERLYDYRQTHKLEVWSMAQFLEVPAGDNPPIYVGELPLLRYESMRQPCDLVVGRLTPDSMQLSENYAIAVNKNKANLYDEVSEALLHLKEQGILHELEYKWWGAQSECTTSK